MVDLFNINCPILFAIDRHLISTLAHQTTHNAKFQKGIGKLLFPDDVRCIKGKGDDDPSLLGRVFLQYTDYIASLQYSSEDEVFYGKILGIDDLVSFEGASVKELKKAFQD